MWTLNSSGVSPENTVRPMPSMPGLTSSTDMNGVAAGSLASVKSRPSANATSGARRWLDKMVVILFSGVIALRHL